ncbi:MAG: toll/interleukin-1 receptor domain-containing protein [Sciscionella sp.]
MIAMIPERGTGLLSIYDYDLATNRTIKRSDMASPHGLPLTVRELSMSDDGRSALVTAPIATTGLEQRRRSGVHVATVIDIDDGAFEPVLPVAYQTGRAQRRHTSPRWCDDPLAMHSGPTTVADELLATATTSLIDPDSPAVNEDRLGRWLETAEGIEQAWRSGRMPAARFGDEFIQHLLNAYEIDECAADALFARLPPTSTAARHIRSSRQRGWRALGVYQEKAATTGSDDHRAAADPAPLPGPGLENVRPILVEMVAARTLADVQNAVARMLSWATPHGLAGDGVWRGLAELSATAMKRKDCLFALYCALVTICWNTEHMRRYPQLARLGLRNSPRSVELEILITGLDAVTRLDQDVLAGSAAGIDADDIRTTFQNRLSELSVANYLRTARTVPGPARTYTIIGPPDPMTRDTGVKERQLTRKRIFVSYVREDMDAVDQLVHALTESGFDVWMDRTHLLPGMRWQSEIKKAIRAGDYFIACFSPRYCNKLVSYMNEELIIAIEQLRLMPRNRRWFVPIMLETCEIPDLPIGPGETFSEFIQYADFSVNWDKAIRAVLDSLGPPTAT